MRNDNSTNKFVRELGRPRKKSSEIRVCSWDKIKPTIVFIKDNSLAWALTKDKEYEIIDTDLISNNDKELCKRVQAKLDKKSHKRLIGSGYSHMMPWYFKIKNDKGNIRCYPQELFKIIEQSKEEGVGK